MLPEVVQYRGHLMDLLHDPEMVALIQAAPEAMGRPLRSLCRLLGLRPPPILAIPPRAAPAAKPPAATPLAATTLAADPSAPAAKPPPVPPRVRSAPAPAPIPATMQRKPA